MPAKSYTARQTAADVVSALHKRGLARAIDAKRVRAWVRDNVAAYDDDGYTAHQYDQRTHDRIVSAMVTRYTAAPKGDSDARGTAASTGRTPSARKSKTAKPSAATPVAESAE